MRRWSGCAGVGPGDGEAVFTAHRVSVGSHDPPTDRVDTRAEAAGDLLGDGVVDCLGAAGFVVAAGGLG